ncbi:aminopeptidase N-like [Ostrea edulis]|uniref:aminopeptidase N-like n=1 Tax=Ostrea edulis TaxID=37623 RepID=UPI0024AFE190|nr:aminopeptidase N-like [Ostrea edulis]
MDKKENGVSSLTKELNGMASSGNEKRDLFVEYNTDRRTGCYLSRFQVTCLILGNLFILCTAVALVAFVKKERIIYGSVSDAVCSCQTPRSHTNVTVDYLYVKNQTSLTVLTENLAETENSTLEESNNVEDSNNEESEETTQLPEEEADPENAPWRKIRLSRDLMPLLYEINLEVDLENLTYRGHVNMTLICTNNTKFVIFHISHLFLDKDSVKVSENGTKNVFKILKQFRYIINQFWVMELDSELSAGTVYKVSVGYRGFLHEDLRGIYLSKYVTPEGEIRRLAATQLQSTDARKTFPCMDEPDMKAAFQLTLTHQEEYEAISNTPRKSERLANGWKTVEFHATPVMSTYLLAIVISDFTHREMVLDNGYNIRVWSQPDKIKQTEYAIDMVMKCYNFFTEYFNITDVLTKSDHVAVPDFSGGAMENWGLVLYRETALLYEHGVSSSENKLMVTLIVAHEVAHTWFGNMVTMRWWDDLWLNEGFASLLMYFAMDAIYPDWNVFTLSVVAKEVFPVMVKDALTTSHPVSTPIATPNDIAESFDSISYSKGMAILRMLMGFVGWEDFQKGLRTYVSKFKYQNAAMDQLWDTFTEAVNYKYDIKSTMNTWTRQMGYPIITMHAQGDSYYLTQSRFLLDDGKTTNSNGGMYDYKWVVPFTYITEGDQEVQLQWMNKSSATIPRTTDSWILANYEYVGYYRVNYEVDMWAQLAGILNRNHTEFPEANRAGLIGDSFNLARAKILDYDVALNMTTYLKYERGYAPWVAFLDSVEYIRSSISKSGAYVLMQKYLRDLVAPVFDSIEMTMEGNLPERYLRQTILKLACNVGYKRAVEYAKGMFYHWKNDGITLPSDFASMIYTVGVSEGGMEEWDYVWNRSLSTNVAVEREMLMQALGQSQKPWLLWRYANWIFDPSKIRRQDVRLVISYLSKRPLGRMISLHLLMTKWDRLNEQFGFDNFLLRETISEVTQFVNSEFEYKQLRTLFKDHPPKVAKKETQNSLALIRANINWMDENYDVITDWLRDHVVGML